ncbi:MAG TPA: hypothetical protein EYH56_03980 [Nanoarchaeota archaeon]|nr:hypothetical protein [Nanoarchaeota archaeon]
MKRKNKITAILVCFTTKKNKFKSASERNRFYWGLYGRKQIIVKKEKRYEYYRGGILEEIPHIKVDNSVFIIAEKYLNKLMNYFKMWEEKVEVKTYPVLVDEKEAKKLVEIKIE